MRLRQNLSARVLLAPALLCLAASAAAQNYTFNFLADPGTRYHDPSSINDAGQVTGTIGNPPHLRAALWDAKQPARRARELPNYDGCCNFTATMGLDINASGQVAGEDRYRAALWNGASRPSLLPQLQQHAQSSAHGLNDAGVAVGYTWLTTGDTRATLWNSSGARDLGTLGGNNSNAYAINEFGTVAGSSQRADGGRLQATLWTHGTAVDIGFAGPLASEAYDINDSGVAVGVGDDRAVMWHGGQATFLDGLGTRGLCVRRMG